MAAWVLSPDRAAALNCPTLSVLGTATLPLFVEVAALLRAQVPDIEERQIEDVGHLLHIQSPEAVARPIADFMGRHPMPRR
jgi:pimeloyl-ACP methyl ester carboxylesterase